MDDRDHGVPLNFDDDRFREQFKHELDEGPELKAEIDAIAQITDRLDRELAISRLAELFKGKIKKSTITELVAERTFEAKRATQDALEQFRAEQLKAKTVDVVQLIAALEKFFAERAHLPQGGALLLAYFAINTWTFELFDTTPYISLESATPGCGKSTVERLLKAVCRSPRAATSISEAVLFRLMDKERPTLLIDEAETLEGRSDRAEALKAIANEGYKAGGLVPRCEGEEHTIKWYDVYGPKVFAAIGGLTGALLERCHVLHMSRAPKGNKRRSTRVRALERDARSLRAMAEAYALQNKERLQQLYEAEPDAGYWPAITDRDAELWSPFLYHARLAGPQLETRLLQVVEIFSEEKADIQAAEWRVAQTIALLEAIRNHQDSEFAPSELLDSLAGDESWAKPFAEVKATGDDAKTAKAAKVGYALRKFRLKRKKNRDGRMVYSKEDAIAILSAHVPEKPPYPPYPPSENPPYPQPVESTNPTESTETTEGFDGAGPEGVCDPAKASVLVCPACGSRGDWKTPLGLAKHQATCPGRRMEPN